MPDPQLPIKTTNLAFNGKSILVDEVVKDTLVLPNPGAVVGLSNAEKDPTSEQIDYTDLATVNSQLVALRNQFFLSRKDLKAANRAVVRTKWAYEGAKKRNIIQISGGTEKTREAAAELMSEKEYGDFLVAQQVAKEVESYHRDLKAELDLLKEISNNLRRLIDLS